VRLDHQEFKHYYFVRKFSLVMNGDVVHTVSQYQYINWPTSMAPVDVTSFVKFLERVRRDGFLQPASKTIVHSTAGYGRPGAFCFVDHCLDLLAAGKFVDDRGILVHLRRER
jgi:protein tyrosine phosphatase